MVHRRRRGEIIMPGQNHIKGEHTQAWTLLMERKREQIMNQTRPEERYRARQELRSIKDIIRTLNQGKY